MIYDRAPSEELVALLRGGTLQMLSEPLAVVVDGNAIPLDPHFRRGDEVHLYAGQTAVLKVARRKSGNIKAFAHGTYGNQAISEPLFRTWKPSELADFEYVARSYLEGVVVHQQHVHKEGRVQLRWMGRDSTAQGSAPWLPLDRELVLADGPHRPAKGSADEATITNAIGAVAELARVRGWTAPRDRRNQNEVDQIAIRDDGRAIVLVELKTNKSDDAAYAPLQVLRYAVEWRRALDGSRASLVEAITALAKVRFDLGFANRFAPPSSEAELVAAIAFNEPPRDQVLRKLEEVVTVLLPHDPTGLLGRLELWCWPDGGEPRRLSSSRRRESSSPMSGRTRASDI